MSINPEFVRPAEINTMLGDASKARAQLGWQPTVDFATLVGPGSHLIAVRAFDQAGNQVTRDVEIK